MSKNDQSYDTASGYGTFIPKPSRLFSKRKTRAAFKQAKVGKVFVALREFNELLAANPNWHEVPGLHAEYERLCHFIWYSGKNVPIVERWNSTKRGKVERVYRQRDIQRSEREQRRYEAAVADSN